MSDQERTTRTGIPRLDAIRRSNERWKEYWCARDLQKMLGYTDWQYFNNVVLKRAMIVCEEHGEDAAGHFKSAEVQGQQDQVEDFYLSRLAAYLVILNNDPKTPQ